MAQGQPKPPPTASDKTRQVSEGKLREAKARMGHAPNFKEWSEGTPHCLRRTLGVVREKKKTSTKEQHELRVFYVSTALPLPKHLPALGFLGWI